MIKFITRKNISKINNNDTNIKLLKYNENKGDNISKYNIINLKLNNEKIKSCNNLPITLNYLNIKNELLTSYNNLPKNINIFKLSTINYNESKTQIKNLPSNINYLSIFIEIFYSSFNNLPNKITNLDIGICNGFEKILKLPNSINKLIFDIPSYTTNTLNFFSHNLKNINFKSLNKNINNLPLNIDKLKFYTLTNICFNNLPFNITNLNMDCRQFNKSLKNLPNKIIKFEIFSHNFEKTLKYLPNSIKTIIQYLPFYNNLDLNINLRKLVLNDNEFNINNLPLNLNYIELSSKFKNNINNCSCNLTTLILFWCFNKNINNLPNKLTKLKLSNDFNKSITKLPKSIKYLIYDCDDSNNLMYLPSITHLEISKLCYRPHHTYAQLLNGEIICKIPRKINTDFFPETLQVLKFTDDLKFNKINDLPSSIKEIWIHKNQLDCINEMYHHKTFLF